MHRCEEMCRREETCCREETCRRETHHCEEAHELAHKKPKDGRPLLPEHVQRVRTMCMIAVNSYDSVSPVCAFCLVTRERQECFLCTLNICSECDDSNRMVSDLPLHLPPIQKLPLCLSKPGLFACSLCRKYLDDRDLDREPS